jgi:hypothetical protein
VKFQVNRIRSLLIKLSLDKSMAIQIKVDQPFKKQGNPIWVAGKLLVAAAIMGCCMACKQIVLYPILCA